MNYNDNNKNTCNKSKCPQLCKTNCIILGPTGPTGPTGPSGSPIGSTGATGETGGVLNFADALMPPDNAATAAPGTDVSFPQDGPNSGSDISMPVHLI